MSAWFSSTAVLDDLQRAFGLTQAVRLMADQLGADWLRRRGDRHVKLFEGLIDAFDKPPVSRSILGEADHLLSPE